ncbi:MAG: 4a-hydroxytetrahydrobiopterin dehydratase [Gammaproteobacteria bacterium]|nr:MAG: 4a-hydroxytetrahydrobiopterin dehydratase [Gammaproteobacteria bacterium]
MPDLRTKHCAVCEGGTAPLDAAQAIRLLEQVPDWALAEDPQHINRRFRFKNFHQTMAFVNAVAWIAHGEDHHPDMEASYAACTVHYSTHAIGGLSENDFICAAKIDGLLD